MTTLPLPSQEKVLRVEPAQVGAVGMVPLGYMRQEARPLQKLLRLQVATPSSEHSLLGSVPAAMVAQTPSFTPPRRTALQASQVPLQARSQQ